MVEQKEVWRKIVHVVLQATAVLFATRLFLTAGRAGVELFLLILLLFLVICDVLIADYGVKLPIFAQLERKHEEECFHTATLAVLSAIVVFALFSPLVALASVSMFVLGDGFAGLAGMRWGKQKFGKKTRAGTLAMFATSFVIGWFLLGWVGMIMAIVATLAESFVLKINDAVTIPLFAGLVGQLLLQVI